MFRLVRWQVVLIVAGIMVLAALMIYLARSFKTELVAAPGGTYTEGVIGQPQYFDPLLCSFNSADQDICSLVFNGLVKFNTRGEPQPDLAEHWVISQGASDYGLIYTIDLRHNVLWQDGQPFTADDVIFTINLLKDPSFPGRPDIGALWRTVEAIKVNDYRVELRLQEPFAPFLDYLSIGMLPAHRLAGIAAGDLLEHPFNRQPIGTGPFRVIEFTNEPGRPPRVLLETHSRYFGRQPFINRIEFKYYPTSADAFAAYNRGEIQGIAPLTINDLDHVRATPSLNLFTAPISGLTMVYLNTDEPNSPFFKDQDVRQALFLALDRQRLIDVALQGQAKVADSIFPLNSWAFDPNVPLPQQDITQARGLLHGAGWIARNDLPPRASPSDTDQGFLPSEETAPRDALRYKGNAPFSFTLLASTDQLEVARELARQWSMVGVQTDVQEVQYGLAGNYLEARQYQAAVANIIFDTPDPDPYPFWHETRAGSGQNYSQFRDRDLSELLEQSRRTIDETQRAQLYSRFMQLFIDYMPSLPLYYPLYSYGVNERIRDVQLGQMLIPADRFFTVADWYVIERRVIVNSGEQLLAP